MSALLLFLAAAASPPPAVRVQAVASARILPGARIDFEAEAAPAAAQRRRIPVARQSDGAPRSELRLIEFQ